MSIEVAPYCLKNSTMTRYGTLLKFQFEKNRIGFADCHAWPEWGDENLIDQLDKLDQGILTSQTRCSLECAQFDALGRSGRHLLLDEEKIPLSHYLIVELSKWTSKDVKRIIQEGFTHVKVKVGRKPEEEISQLIHLFYQQPLQLRLDANEKFSFEDCQDFLQQLQSLHSQIEFIEDPCPFHANEWKVLQQQGWILACDRQVKQGMYQPDSAKILIMKPAIHSFSEWKLIPHQHWIVTSYMAHPLDQLWAAYIASSVDPKKKNVHGLLSHYVYENNAFSQELTVKGPHFSVPKGVGFGFNQQFMNLDWQPWN